MMPVPVFMNPWMSTGGSGLPAVDIGTLRCQNEGGDATIRYILVNTGDEAVNATRMNLYVYNESDGVLIGEAVVSGPERLLPGSRIARNATAKAVIISNLTLKEDNLYTVEFEFLSMGGYATSGQC